ncbi:MAG: hypothetical protein KR126chlam1_00548 [Chlamydiae bacterium]|nr:hypothetical protein [Chlamydiota bacterium]
MVDSQKPRPYSSMKAFAQRVAKTLRLATKTPSPKKRKVTKDPPLSSANKIEQIAKMLRSQVNKRRKKD